MSAYTPHAVNTEKKTAQQLQQLVKAELRPTFANAPSSTGKVTELFTPAGYQLGYEEIDNARDAGGTKMTWEENDKAICQAHYQSAILYPSLMIQQQVDVLRNTLADVADSNSTIKPDMAISMNERLLEDLKIAFPDELATIQKFKDSKYNFAERTRIIWTAGEWVKIRPNGKILSEDYSVDAAMKSIENIAYYSRAYKFP